MKTPKTLDEAVEILYNEFAAEKDFYDEVREGKSDIVSLHHTTGSWIRNNWGLWAGSELRDSFFEMGLFHADDMSGIILGKVQARIRQDEFNLESEIKRYQNYWKEKGIDIQEEIQRLKEL